MIDVEKEDAINNSLTTTSSAKASLVKQGNELTDKILSEQDQNKLDELTQLFNINQKKKQLARINKISNLVELIDDEVIARFSQNPEVIEDDNLLRYWRTAQDSLIPKENEQVEIPRVTINNQTNINMNSSGLNRESRAKVLEYVQQVLSSLHSDENNDIIDIEPKEK